jgi:hypothetical protein
MRSPRPSDPAHTTHDELLVARLAGRDELDPREHAMASALVAGCPDCARLASDIAAIARAVASEPIPPRRRDFRINPEQARALRGSPLQRLLRRVTLPASGGPLRPLATGALSVGLVLVFVGSVVPRPSGAPMAAPAAQVEADLRESGDDGAASKAEPSTPTEPEPVDTIGSVESMAMEMTAPGEAASSPVPGLADAGTEADSGVEAPAPESDVRARDRSLAADASPAPAAAVAPFSDARADTDDETATDTAAADPSLAVSDAATFAERQALPEATLAAGRDEPIGAADRPPVGTEEAGTSADTTVSGVDAGTILVVTGLALVAVGIVLALLLFLSRRHPDAARS